MLKKGFYIILSFLFMTACYGKSDQVQGKSFQKNVTIDGEIKSGLRLISLEKDTKKNLTVYRGDYIVPVIKDESSFTVTIPTMKIVKSYPVKGEEKEYIKMKKTGSFDITAGNYKGKITVVEYTEPHYRAISSKEANELIKNISPVILDVRTEGEYNRGHLKDSKLIPIQNLFSRIHELEEYKEKNILIYCATGNRSTVASKILIDKGFKSIYNMRFGIADWENSRLPTVK